MADVTATYSLNPDGTVAVVNGCRLSNGETTRSAGVATALRTTRAAPAESELPAPLAAMVPLGRGDYWVVMLDPDYATRW